MVDQIFHPGITYLEELLTTFDDLRPLHLLLSSPGGDGEVAIRMLRLLQARCSELTIIVPDMAKSAATIMSLGADHILMGPGSDLGPVDPQFLLGNGALVGAKEITQAVTTAEERVAANPDSFPLYSGLLADVNMLMVEQAKAQMARSYDLIKEALSCAGRSRVDVEDLAAVLNEPLIDSANNHGATIGPDMAETLGLPIVRADLKGEQWKLIWSLWTRYFDLGAWPAGGVSVYEGRVASQVRG